MRRPLILATLATATLAVELFVTAARWDAPFAWAWLLVFGLLLALGFAGPRTRSSSAGTRRARFTPYACSVGIVAVVFAVGLDMRTGSPAVATIPFGEAYLVSGPSRSARSAVMRAIASSAKHADPEIRVFAVEAPGGDLSTGDAVDDRPLGPDDVAAWVVRIATWTGRRIVVVDDADRLGGASFDRLAALADDQVAVVAAGRVESLRTTGHWTTPLHGWRRGALIRPTASDGELLGVALADDAARLARHAGLLVDHGSTTPFMAVVGEHHAPAEPSRR